MRSLLLTAIGSLCCLLAGAQLRADFSPDRPGGCAPVAVAFTNSSTGNSAQASYHWELGNGNTSSLKDASATYANPGTYTVVLTITDGGQVSTQTKTIRIYANPAADFSITPAQGCLGTTSTLTANASSADGSITDYHWDLGDGNTRQGTNPVLSYQYTMAGSPTVSLTVVNSFGCAGTIVKPAATQILPALNAAFSTPQGIICNAPALVHFDNQSSGPGTLSYAWEFGDGGTSTQQAPDHTYASNGDYTVTLTVRNETGCETRLTKPSLVRMQTVFADFPSNVVYCTRTPIQIPNLSTPGLSGANWVIDGDFPVITYFGAGLNYIFQTPGTHEIRMTAFWNGCQATIVKQVEVRSGPALDGFLATLQSTCGAPVQVQFSDTTAAAVSWKWNFLGITPEVMATDRSPTYTYTEDNNYRVKLTVKDAAGCESSAVREIQVIRPLVGIFITGPDNGCSFVNTSFEARSTEPIATYNWVFGDGATSTDAAPAHNYTTAGDFEVTLNYVTTGGCRGTARYQSIHVKEKPVANFTGPSSICGNTPVHFDAGATTGYFNGIAWNYGDNTGVQWSNDLHQYQQAGVFDVTLIAFNDFCADTITKPAYISVAPPFPDVTNYLGTCEGTRGQVTMLQNTRSATSGSWVFGDGTSLTETVTGQPVMHTFNATGTYNVVLTANNGSCTVRDSITVYVLIRKTPLLTASATSICTGASLNINVTNLDRPTLPATSNIPPYYDYMVQDDAGNNLNAQLASSNSNTPWSNSIGGFAPGQHRIRVITTSRLFNCTDTSNYIDFTVTGPAAAMQVANTSICFRSSLQVTDVSTAGNGVSLVRCSWDFGDGVTLSSPPGATVEHVYAAPGTYSLTLRVTDQSGCTSVSRRSILVTGPVASFVISPASPVQLNSNVVFTNTSNTINAPATRYEWTIAGQGPVSTESTSQFFSVAGTYPVTLVAINDATGCRDTVTRSVTVANFNTAFNTSLSYIGDEGRCAPVLARFSNQSSNFTRLVWNFGDGSSLENSYSPTHIYTQPGEYQVSLIVYGYNNLVDTFRTLIQVARPQIGLAIPDLEACAGDTLLMHAETHTGATAYTWDFGNGFVSGPVTDTFAMHVFADGGSYLPSVIATDANGCRTQVNALQPIVVHPGAGIVVLPDAAHVCRDQGVLLNATGGNSYQWSPAAGLSNPTIANPYALPAVTTHYTVRSQNIFGCTGESEVLVEVAAPVTISTDTALELCRGSAVQLTVDGATNIQWIGDTRGLSDPGIATPTASPLNTIRYTVVGSDQYHCYADTLSILITVEAVPVIDAGADQQVIYGSPVQLHASETGGVINGSPGDVVRWTWSPVQYLDCASCPSPVSRPYEEMQYVVTGYTEHGCAGRDSVIVKPVCGEQGIYLATAFSPNGDGINDRFAVTGAGVRQIRSFRIFNRWGEMIFNRVNFLPGSVEAAWDGRYKGIEAPIGVYVYQLEMQCGEGEVFVRKGVVTLIR